MIPNLLLLSLVSLLTMGQTISSYFGSGYNFNITSTQRELFDYMSDYNNLEQVQHFKNKYKDKLPFYNYMQPETPPQKSCPFYELFIYIDPQVSQLVRQTYFDNAAKHNALIESYIQSYNDLSANDFTFNAGFDLLSPDNIIINDTDETLMLNHKIKTCMKRNNKFVGFYLYMRSSTASKTPLRLANNVGIIDSGYRGYIKALFDIKSLKNKNKLLDVTQESSNIMEFKLHENDRFVQICPPILDYPMKIIIVDNINDLGNKTNRGEGGFGSTGNNGNLI